MNYDVADLRRYLLGTIDGKGLIERVAERVQEVSSSIAPRFRTNWYIPTRGAGHENESAEGLIDRVFDLALAMNEWLGPGIGRSHPHTHPGLVTYLRRNRITDVSYLIGVTESESHRLSEDDQRDLKHGKLQEVGHEVKRLLQPDSPSGQAVERCDELMRFLRGWLGNCDHDFVQEPSDDPRIIVMKCHCGAGYWESKGEWAQVGG